ncbi:MAG: hypothetical protein Q7S61_01560 [bacterium]|nr:hypothetical protein [bacterium]
MSFSRRKNIFIAIILFIIIDILLFLYIKQSDISSKKGIIFINNDSNIQLDFNSNESILNKYIKDIEIFNKQGVIDINDVALDKVNTVKSIQLIFQKGEYGNKYLVDRSKNTYISYFLQYNNPDTLIITYYVNYSLKNNLSEELQKIQTKRDIEYIVLYLLRRYSNKYGMNSTTEKLDSEVVKFIKNNSPKFILVKSIKR